MTRTRLNDGVFGYTQAGGFAATARLNANQSARRAGGAVSSLPNAMSVDADGLPVGSFGTNQNRFDTLPTSHYTNDTAVTNVTSPPANYTFNQTTSRVAAPTGLGADHPDALMTAYVGGVMQTVTFNPSTAASGTTSAPFVINGAGYVYLQGNASRMGAAFAVVNPNTPTSAEMSEAIFQFGAASPGDPNNSQGLNSARTAYIDRTNFAARGAALYQNGNELETSIITDNNSGQSVFGRDALSERTLSRTGLRW